ncbi:MAG TPA: restriction endonuclease [Oscillospiraceae bacterium]|nr:restriction endonuclease [Oscillospiraceae bacterium]HRW57482.1 restriction endonuclease [Oscillospiraceae bacterium]
MEEKSMDGRAFERYVAELFRGMGYAVGRTEVTGDFGADLILERGGRKTVVQCKDWNGKAGVAAIQQITGARAYYGADEMIAAARGGFTRAAEKLAESNGVRLLDGDDLKELAANLPGVSERFPAAAASNIGYSPYVLSFCRAFCPADAKGFSPYQKSFVPEVLKNAFRQELTEGDAKALDAQLRDLSILDSESRVRMTLPEAAAVLRKEKRRFLRRKLLTYLVRILCGSGLLAAAGFWAVQSGYSLLLYACILLWAVFFLDLSVNFFRYRKALRRRFAEGERLLPK